MSNQKNQRDIDAILNDCRVRFSQEGSPLYQGKHEDVTVYANGRNLEPFFPRSSVIEYYERPDVRLDVFERFFPGIDDEMPEGGKQLTTEAERRELIDFFKERAAFEERQHEHIRDVKARAKKELRKHCESIDLKTDDKACDYTLSELRQYMWDRENSEQLVESNPDSACYFRYQIDEIIELVINNLIHNKEFLIEGGQGRDREPITYKNYRMGRARVHIRFSVLKSLFSSTWEQELLGCTSSVIIHDSSNIDDRSNIDDTSYKDNDETWKWTRITFNEAQIKQVLPFVLEKQALVTQDRPMQAASKEELLEAAYRVNNAKLAVNHKAGEKVGVELRKVNLFIPSRDFYQKTIRQELEKYPDRQSTRGAPRGSQRVKKPAK